MKRTLVGRLPELHGQRITLAGWVHAVRKQKRMQFVILRDHTGMVQCVHDRETNEAIADVIRDVTAESAVIVTGTVHKNDDVKLGQLEIIVEGFQVVGPSEPSLPIDEKSSLDVRLDWRFLDLRTPENHLIFRIQTAVEHAMRTFWMQNGFMEIHSPKFMESASESGAELFEVKYFDRVAYLAQSPQFYKQMAMAAGFERIFEIGPVFRANPSFTSRHDTEFTSVDVEMSWIESHDDIMQFEERWLAFVLKTIKDELGDAIQKVFGQDIRVPALPFPRMTMAEAYEALERVGYKVPRGGKGDLDPEGERLLSKCILEKHDHEFVFVTDYPIFVRPFYHMRYKNDLATTKSFDLLWKGLEITTGAQREHRYDVLVKQAKEKGLNTKPIQYYLDFFRYGCPPHGGFGFGLSRMLMILVGAKNVREVTYLYRGPNRLRP